MSLPLIICFQRCSIEEKRLMEIIIRKKTFDNDDFIKILNLMKKYNVEQDCINKAKHFSIMANMI